MDYRSAYIRRSRKGSRLKQRLAAVGVLGVAACAALYAFAMHESTAPAVSAQAHAPAAAATPAPTVLRTAAQVETKKTRRVYPYSIVPGGVLDRRELTHAVAVDQVVAEHYAAFEAGKTTIKTVDKPRAVYVSYRKGDKVFWTAKKLQLAKGETLLSDGQNEIRTRCGNRISDVPQLPVEAKGPSEEELDSSVEQAQEDGGAVEQVGYAADTNPAGHGYQLQTFGTGETAQTGGTAPTRTSFGLNGNGSAGLGPIWDGGTLPVSLAGVSSDTAGTGTDGGSGTGTPGSGGITAGTDSGGSGVGGDPGKTGGTTPGGATTPDGTPDTGTLPISDPGTKSPTSPGSTPPGTLLPPTDQPGLPNGPGKAPVKPHGDVPEPDTLWLAGAGVAALLAARRAKKRTRK
ncbi:PEP-CTERM motif-containing protein [Massilia sp. PDC64]|nr:PEP-CTERM sorting domain-containing protein [Massilia sp. PDC64]SDD96595.1 PEP-CTERM motif-containing protein [Massilia sp. PDC64]